MDIYFSKDIHIAKLTSYNEYITNTITLKQKHQYNIFGYNFGNIVSFYETNGGNQYKSLNDALYSYGTKYYKIIPTDNENVYNIVKKPYVYITLTNGETYEKGFENDMDMKEYIKKLPLTNLHNLLTNL